MADDARAAALLAERWARRRAVRASFRPWAAAGRARACRRAVAEAARERAALRFGRRRAFRALLTGLRAVAAADRAEAADARAQVQRRAVLPALAHAWHAVAEATVEPKREAADAVWRKRSGYRIIALWQEGMIVSKRERALEEHKQRMWAKVNSWIADM